MSDAAKPTLDCMKLARTAYEGYCESTGGVSLVSGAKLPCFDALAVEIQQAWIAAATAVAVQVMDVIKARI